MSKKVHKRLGPGAAGSRCNSSGNYRKRLLLTDDWNKVTCGKCKGAFVGSGASAATCGDAETTRERGEPRNSLACDPDEKGRAPDESALSI